MKKRYLYIARSGILILVLLAFIFYFKYPKYDKDKQYVKEYVIGEEGIKGQVDINLYGDDSAYEIGANKEGYAVFKNPDKAFSQMKSDFTKGIDAIKKEYKLLPLARWNFEEYGEYGCQLSQTEDSEAQMQATKLSGYLDIYENSFAN